MIQNISIRVPWHDNKWNGTICKDPKHNVSCLRLKSISENKDEDFECENCGKCMEGCESGIHCIRESGAFMSPIKLKQKIEHPYKLNGNKEYQHMAPTTIEIKPYSFVGRCFDWLMVGGKYKKINRLIELLGINFNEEIEPNIGFESNWAQNAINQKAIMDEFYKDVKPNESIIVAYAKQVPFIEDTRRVIVALGNVKKVNSAKEYNVIKGCDNDYRGMTFETIIEHSIREDNKCGFIIPYIEIEEYIKKHENEGLDIKDYTIFAPNENFYDFSFATQHMFYDATLDILYQCKSLYKKIRKMLNNEFKNELKYIDDTIEKVKEERSNYPGLPVMLYTVGINKGIVLGKYVLNLESINNNLNIWDLIGKCLKDRKSLDDDILRKNLEKADYNIWNSIANDNVKIKIFKLLSRFELTRAQAKYIWEKYSKENDEINGKKILNNPYILYEKTRLKPINYLSLDDDSQIPIKTIDRALLKIDDENSKYLFEVDEPIDGTRDERRLRAILVSILEEEVENGSTFIYQNEALDRINKYFELNEENTHISIELLNSISDFLKEEILTRSDKAGNKYYKLCRINAFDYIIESTIKERLGLKDNINRVDWDKKYDESIEIQKNEKSIPKKIRDNIKKESINALNIISKRRISVLTGGAGVGKTTLINVLCSATSISKNGILLLAPTGKAAVNIRCKVGSTNENIESLNVAQFLMKYKRYNWKTQKYFLLNDSNYTEHKTIIIDESSMLTVDMLACIFQVCKNADRIILVGDPNQLPPIGAGKPFVDIIDLLCKKENENIKYIAPLNIVKRQLVDKSGVRFDLLLADCFKYNKNSCISNVFDLLDKNKENIDIIKYDNRNDLEEKIINIITKIANMRNSEDIIHFDSSLGGTEKENWRFVYGSAKDIEDWQLLIPNKNNTSGTIFYNKLLHNKYRCNDIEYFNDRINYFGSENIVYGDKVINVINDERNGYNYSAKKQQKGYVANGEIGVVCKFSKPHFNPYSKKQKIEYINVEFSSQLGLTYGYMDKDMGSDGDNPFLELAYALTIHKAQGSQFNVVILVLDEPCRLLKRELLYTALTRQKNKIIIFYNNASYKLLEYSKDCNSEIITRKTDLFADRLLDYKPSFILNKGKYLDEKLINKTAKGEFVRSKSELIIADKLYNADIEYNYEEELILDRKLKLPDFTIYRNGRTLYWEHLGMLDNEAYRLAWEAKKKFYEKNGIVEGVNLIISQDENGGIDSKKIDDKIKWILNL